MNTKTKLRLWNTHLLAIVILWIASMLFLSRSYFRPVLYVIDRAVYSPIFVVIVILSGLGIVVYMQLSEKLWKLENVGRGKVGRRRNRMGAEAHTEKP